VKNSCLLIIVEVVKDSGGALEVGFLQIPHAQ